MATICQPGRALPKFQVSQQDVLTALHERYQGVDQLDRLLRLIENTTVEYRYFIQPLERLFTQETVATRMDRYMHEGVPLAVKAISQALDHARLSAKQINHFILTSCTTPGILLPGIDAWLANILGFFSVRRLPIAHMGCHAGVTALAQGYEYLLAHPDDNVLICALELCSLNEQPADTDVSSFVSRGLFGDGCGAVVMKGNDRRSSGLRIQATKQYLVPDSLAHLQYQVDETGTHFRTNPEVVPGLKQGFLAIHAFLQQHGYHPADLDFVATHTGGKRLMDAVVSALAIEEQLIAASRESLREVGNLSSVTILDVLSRTFERYRPRAGALGLVLGFGPGSTLEMALGQWQEQ